MAEEQTQQNEEEQTESSAEEQTESEGESESKMANENDANTGGGNGAKKILVPLGAGLLVAGSVFLARRPEIVSGLAEKTPGGVSEKVGSGLSTAKNTVATATSTVSKGVGTGVEKIKEVASGNNSKKDGVDDLEGRRAEREERRKERAQG